MLAVDRQRLIDLFVDMAKVKSPSGEEEPFAIFLVNYLLRFGFNVWRDSYGNVLATKPGIGKPIVLCSHMDTVPVGGDIINPIVDGDIIRSDGNTILGADNKDSIAAIFEALHLITENSLAHRPIEIIFTRQEEQISLGAKNLDLSGITGTECVISDNAAPYGIITVSAPYNYRFNVTITGLRAHAKEPERGIDSLRILSKAIADEAMPLGRVDELTTSNIAHGFWGLNGEVDKSDMLVNALINQPRNTIPDIANIFGEVRSLSRDSLEQTLSKIEMIFEKVAKFYGGKISWQVISLADGYHHILSDCLIGDVSNIFRSQGIEPELFNSIGGSDANVLCNMGIKTVVISSAHRDNHQKTERVLINDLILLADFYQRLIYS